MEQRIITIYNIPEHVNESVITGALTHKRAVIFHSYFAISLDGSTPFECIPSYLNPQRFLTAIGREPAYGSDYWVYFEDSGVDIMDGLKFLSLNSKKSGNFKYCIIITRSNDEFYKLGNAAISIDANVETTNDLFQRCHICPHPQCGRPFATEVDLNIHIGICNHRKSIHVNVFPGHELDFSATVKAFLPYNPIKISKVDDHISVYFNSYEESNTAMDMVNHRRIEGTTVSVKAPLTEFTVYISGFPAGTKVEDIETAVGCNSVNYIVFRSQKHMCFVSLEDKYEYDNLLGSSIRVKGKILTVKEKIDGPFKLALHDLPPSATIDHIRTFYNDMEIECIELGERTSDTSLWYVTFKKEPDFDRALKKDNYFGTKIRVKKIGKFQGTKKDKKGDNQQSSTKTPPPPSQPQNTEFSIIVMCHKSVTSPDIRTKYNPYGIKNLDVFQHPDNIEYHITFTTQNGYIRSFEVKDIYGHPAKVTPKDPSLYSKIQAQQQQQQQQQQQSQKAKKTQAKQQPYQPPQQTKKVSQTNVDGDNDGEENYIAYARGYSLGSTEADLRKLFARSKIESIEFKESLSNHYCFIHFKDKASLDAALALNGVNSLVVEEKKNKKKKKADKIQPDKLQQPDFLKIPPPLSVSNQTPQSPSPNPFAPPVSTPQKSPQKAPTPPTLNPFAPPIMTPKVTPAPQQFYVTNSPTTSSTPQIAPQNLKTTSKPVKMKTNYSFRRMKTFIKEEASELMDDAFNFDDSPLEISLEEAIKQARFHDIDEMMDACNEKVRKIGKMWSRVLTEDDIKAILIYTYESEDDDLDSPYKIVNSSLGSRKVSAIRRVRAYVLYLLRALRKLHRADSRKVLYRGINGDKVSDDKYKQGSEVVWSGFSSATTDEEIAKIFTGESEFPILFVIRGNYIGYNIEKVSFRETEKEVILEPKTKFRVEGVVSEGIFKKVFLSVIPYDSLLLRDKVESFTYGNPLTSVSPTASPASSSTAPASYSGSSTTTYSNSPFTSSDPSLINSGQCSTSKNISRKPPSYNDAVSQKQAEEGVPDGWTRLYSEQHKRNYYVNKTTGESVWTVSEINEKNRARSQYVTPQTQQPYTTPAAQSYQQCSSSYQSPQYFSQTTPQYTQPSYQSPQYPSQQPLQYPRPYSQQPVSPQSYPQSYPQQSASPQSYPQSYPQQPVSPQSYPQSYPQQPVSPQVNFQYPQQSSQYPPRQQHEWYEITLPDGRKYYQNNITKKTQWVKPQAVCVPIQSPQTQ